MNRKRKWRVYHMPTHSIYYPYEITFIGDREVQFLYMDENGNSRSDQISLYYEDGESETVIMGWTGMQCSKGKDIYEGDILMIGEEGQRKLTHIALVVWQNLGYKLKPNWVKDEHDYYIDFDAYFGGAFDPVPVEVVGNRYENPELI